MAKAPKPFKPVVVTANHLRSGAVLFRDASGGWTVRISDAWVAETVKAAEMLLAEAKADAIAVDPVPIEVIVIDGAPEPISLRERIRASGPTAETVPPMEAADVSL
jgi:hypothetical protein